MQPFFSESENVNVYDKLEQAIDSDPHINIISLLCYQMTQNKNIYQRKDYDLIKINTRKLNG